MILGIVAGANRQASVQALIVPHIDASPYVAAYPVTSAGFGVRYADPITKPAGDCHGIVQSADKKTIYLSGYEVSSPIAAYAWGASGFGVKRANPVDTPKPSGFIAISAGGDIGVSHTAANGTFSVWATNPDGSIGAKYASPAGMISSNCYGGVGFNADAFFAAVNDSPYVHAWAFTAGVGFGAKYANPASPPTGATRALAVSNSTILVSGNLVTNQVKCYGWSASGFGGVSTLNFSSNIVYGIGINKSNDAFVATPAYSLEARSYRLSGGAIGASINTMPYTGNPQGQGADFNKDDSLVAVGTHLTPFITVANWNNATGFGAKLASPTSLPGGSAWRPKFVYT